MKKYLVYLLSVLLLATGATAFVGCGTAEDEYIHLLIWHDKEEEVADVLAEFLAVLEPEITVTLERKSGLTEALKLVGNDASNAPDMYFFAHDKIGMYAEMNIIVPITELVSEESLAGFLDKTIAASTYQGEIYQLPIYFETLLFMYNKDLMSENDIPSTTGDLFGFMQRNMGGNSFGFVEQYTNAYFNAGWIHGFGGQIIDEYGVPMLNSPEFIQALEYYRQFVRMMPGEAEFATISTLFREGLAAATIGGPWLVPGLRNAGIDLGLAPMPIVSETGLPLAPYMGVQGIHVLRVATENERRAEAIGVLLNHLISTDIGVALAEATGSAPALEAAFELDIIQSNEMVMMMYETAQTAIPIPNIPEMDVMWVVTSDLLTEVNLRGEDIETAANAAQERAEGLIELMR